MALHQAPGKALVEVRSVDKRHKLGRVPVAAPAGVSVDILAHRFTVISGPLGSGHPTRAFLSLRLETVYCCVSRFGRRAARCA